ncbi:hypothetical protein C8J57DRAFT_760175 [Mycena rebaudengoi]|nr:hypothetical protein C8J57DRAFT_760175 [Mycena rebaudengoi]
MLIKRAPAMPPPGSSTLIAISSDGDKSKGLIRSVQRTRALDAPIGEILSCRHFDPTGQASPPAPPAAASPSGGAQRQLRPARLPHESPILALDMTTRSADLNPDGFFFFCDSFVRAGIPSCRGRAHYFSGRVAPSCTRPHHAY